MRPPPLLLVGWLLALAGPAQADQQAVAEVLNKFHQAASEADGRTYFSLFAAGGVFIGSDAGERWTVADFKAYAEPHFAKGAGWTYTPRQRHIALARDGNVAWFDELLDNEKYGTSRGTGVLVLEDGHWRIAQYHLTFPIPNDLAADFTKRIKEYEAAKD